MLRRDDSGGVAIGLDGVCAEQAAAGAGADHAGKIGFGNVGAQAGIELQRTACLRVKMHAGCESAGH